MVESITKKITKAIKRIKINKTAGPDKTRGGLVKLLVKQKLTSSWTYLMLSMVSG